jgi:hypothetical protein
LSTFRVAAVVKEPAPLIDRFVGWYLAAGAAGITLYFDDPADPAIAACCTDPRVTAVPCTPDFWRGIGQEPDARFTLRQNAAITAAYGQAHEDWLLVVDADELVHLAHGTIAGLLAAQGPEVRSLMVEPAEFVHAPGGGAAFRLPIGRGIVNRVYGDEAELFRKRHGLIGHSTGKAFHRSGQTGIWLRQHWAVDAAGEAVPFASAGRDQGAYLLHYLAPDYPQWRAKMEWRLASSGFHGGVRALIDAIMAQAKDREAGFAALYDRMHRIDAAMADRLRGVGGLLDLPAEFAPVPA